MASVTWWLSSEMEMCGTWPLPAVEWAGEGEEDCEAFLAL